MGVTAHVGSLRERRGLSASELARAVGVSRQTIYAIEAGAFTPNTVVAIRMARLLGVHVEDLFELEESPAEPAQKLVAQPIADDLALRPGQAVQVCRVGERAVVAPLRPRTEQFPSGANGLVASAGAEFLVELAGGAVRENDLVIVGCDPGVSLLEPSLAAASIGLLSWPANSSAALRLLHQGKAHLAGFHMRSGENGEPALAQVLSLFDREPVSVIRFADWEEGLAVAPGNPKQIKSIADLARPDLKILNRETGSGARHLLDALLEHAGIPASRVTGYSNTVNSHVAIASEVLAGNADCGVCVGSAARLVGTGFVPLVSEHYDFVVRTEMLDASPMKRLLEELNRTAFRRHLEGVCGYDLHQAGAVRRLT